MVWDRSYYTQYYRHSSFTQEDPLLQSYCNTHKQTVKLSPFYDNLGKVGDRLVVATPGREVLVSSEMLYHHYQVVYSKIMTHSIPNASYMFIYTLRFNSTKCKLIYRLLLYLFDKSVKSKICYLNATPLQYLMSEEKVLTICLS